MRMPRQVDLKGWLVLCRYGKISSEDQEIQEKSQKPREVVTQLSAEIMSIFSM